VITQKVTLFGKQFKNTQLKVHLIKN